MGRRRALAAGAGLHRDPVHLAGSRATVHRPARIRQRLGAGPRRGQPASRLLAYARIAARLGSWIQPRPVPGSMPVNPANRGGAMTPPNTFALAEARAIWKNALSSPRGM